MSKTHAIDFYSVPIVIPTHSLHRLVAPPSPSLLSCYSPTHPYRRCHLHCPIILPSPQSHLHPHTYPHTRPCTHSHTYPSRCVVCTCRQCSAMPVTHPPHYTGVAWPTYTENRVCDVCCVVAEVEVLIYICGTEIQIKIVTSASRILCAYARAAVFASALDIISSPWRTDSRDLVKRLI